MKTLLAKKKAFIIGLMAAALPLINLVSPAGAVLPQTPLNSKTIPKYMEPVPTFVKTFNNYSAPNSRINAVFANGTAIPLTVSMHEFKQQILPASMVFSNTSTAVKTTVWGYKVNSSGPHYPAFTIEAKKGKTTSVTYENNLPAWDDSPDLRQNIPVDQTIHWADPLTCMSDPNCDPLLPYNGPVPAVVHLHGGEVPSAFDGGPDSWFTPGGTYKGLGYVSNVYTYPNQQEATTLFYHDHVLGATRLNLYAGLVGFYLLRDDNDTGMPGNPLGLPAGPYEVELAIQDKMFDTRGQLLFPSAGLNPDVHPFWTPEFIGDTIVVNGKTWPYLNVEPRRYRLRLVNGANARFFELRLMNRATKTAGPGIWQIGSDGGLLNAPVNVPRLLIAPGERADVIIDFSAFAGQTLTMINSARAPFPKGTAPDPQTVGQIMQFRVGTTVTGGTDNSFNPAVVGATLRGGAGQPAVITPLANGAGALGAGVTASKVRQLTLNEVMGPLGPLEVLLNNEKWGANYTENPRVGDTEVWEIINVSADTHPIHLHLVQFQVINRQAFNTSKYNSVYNAAFPSGVYEPSVGPPMAYGTDQSCRPNTIVIGGNPCVDPYLQDGIRLPATNERGWKDTVRMNPGEVTRVVVRWAPQETAVDRVTAGTNFYPFDPTATMGTTDTFGFPGGPGYVWHCHIVDHEDNEMMRPYQVQN